VNIPSATWIGLIVGLFLLVFVVPAVARSVARLDQDARTFRLVMASGALKLAAAPLWIYVNDHYYSGVADAYGYSRVGAQVAAQIRNGDFSFHVGRLIGDGATSIITGIVYTVIGSNILGGFFVFAFLGFVSLVLFYRAFRVALPEGDHRRYAKLVFFFPSLLFWTSAIGKDALISLGLGLGALGAARILARARGGFVLLGIGLCLTALIRPHIALILFAALAVAYLVSKSKTASPLNPLAKLLGAVVLVVGGLVLAKVTAHFFGLQSLSVSSIQQVLNTNASNTGAGAGTQGSRVAASVSLSPASLPKDIYYVLIRPLPFQAHGLTQLASSLENAFLVVLLIASWRRLASAFTAMRRHPYLLLAVLYSLVWIILFASLGNLGLLVREQTSLLPLLLVLVSWPAATRARETSLSTPEDGAGRQPLRGAESTSHSLDLLGGQ
jgi:hypothetical protein